MENFDASLAAVCADFCKDYPLRPEQIEAIHSVCLGSNTFCLMPTGFGKSDIFALAPMVIDKINNATTPSIAIIICPLRALVRDQEKRWSSRGLQAVGLFPQSEMSLAAAKGVKDGSFTHIFTNPETISEEPWNTVFRNMSDRISVLAFDEAHCIVTWGKTFREKYLQIRTLRSYLKYATALCLTATTTDKVTDEIEKVLGISGFNKIQLVPNRSNVHLAIDDGKATVEESLKWYVDILASDGPLAPKAIIFCRSLETVNSTYRDIVHLLLAQGGDDYLVEVFHAHLDEESEADIPTEFCDEDNHARCLISTVAFGLGMQVNNVKYVFHWGPPASVLDYFQQTGRCARDGSDGYAIMYKPPNSVRSDRLDEDMLSVVHGSKVACIRFAALKFLRLKDFSFDELKEVCFGSKCCSFCDSQNVK